MVVESQDRMVLVLSPQVHCCHLVSSRDPKITRQAEGTQQSKGEAALRDEE
jgi:hypothetical protein